MDHDDDDEEEQTEHLSCFWIAAARQPRLSKHVSVGSVFANFSLHSRWHEIAWPEPPFRPHLLEPPPTASHVNPSLAQSRDRNKQLKKLASGLSG